MPVAMKVDLLQQHKADYVTPRRPVLVEVAPARYLTITGHGEPGGAEFTARLGALYGAAYTIKMARKQASQDFKVAPLEGLWWTDSGETDPQRVPREQWNWKLLIRVPAFVEEQDLEAAGRALRARKKAAEIARVRLETIDEGLCVQVLHVGPYADEPTTLAKMESFAQAQGLIFRGDHHEIYLSDPGRVPSERLRTILRHPVERRTA